MKNRELVNALVTAGVVVMIMGVISAGFLLNAFSKGTPFSKGELELREVGIVLGYLVYHVAGGILCIGVAYVLREVDKLGVAVASALLERARAGTRSSADAVGRAATTKCPSCGKTYNEDMSGQFCEECGKKI